MNDKQYRRGDMRDDGMIFWRYFSSGKERWISAHEYHNRHLNDCFRMVWQSMIYRCQNFNNPYYQRYGGRGITVCDKWHDFKNFKADMYPSYDKELQLDRIDNDLSYSPENCRWVTSSQNNQNRSDSIFKDSDYCQLLNLRNNCKMTWKSIANLYGSHKSVPALFVKRFNQRSQCL